VVLKILAQVKFNIEVPGIFETAEDVYNIPIKVTRDAVVTLSDIGEIKRTFKDYSSFAKVNGEGCNNS